MINQFELRNFKGHERTTLDLGRFTVLVGDNASGKTSVLEALALLSALAPNPISALQGAWSPADLLRRGASAPIVLVALGKTGDVAMRTLLRVQEAGERGRWQVDLRCERGEHVTDVRGLMEGPGGTAGGAWNAIRDTVGTATLYRLRPDRIAAAAIIQDAELRIEPDGANTSVVLANMKLANDEDFERVEASMRRLVPAVQRVRANLGNVHPTKGKTAVSRLSFDFRGAPGVPAHGASNGTLIVLALLAILHGPNRPQVILLDDFDHALHPRAQKELVRMIKELLALEEFRDVQIVATTHSPFTLDEFDPSEVYAFAPRDNGIVASKRLSAHPEARNTAGALTSGQLWSLDPERDWVLRD